eukprot:CAMPEP_0116082092 /NCGR_PEP_ID=MMETSP0327-20121206/2550_1 /TAXON_ID=44447 /ORGANISM="Pseudo-nitzschia delicatissima, Strain B596" /LENGTH=483 /DNA_ID=CAMNT_0003572879 /DNA_START=26 /DNA_END=1477 /DNA_ORIENTATION=+
MSEAKQMAIAILPKFSGFFSIIGSGFIIYDILCSHFNVQLDWFRKKSEEDDASHSGHGGGSSGFSRQGAMANAKGRSSRRFGERKTLMNSAYYRLMLAMSCSDFIVSIAWFCTTWPIPKDENSIDNPSEKVYGNIGNMSSCTAQAFFIQLGIITPFYNALLSIYYYLTIRREWKESEFKKKVEFIGHFVAVSFGLGTSIAGLAMELYNNSVVWCWIAPYPMGCGDGPDQTPCVRGLNSKALRWAFYYGPLWACIFLVAFFMSMVYMYVRGLDVKMEQYTNKYAEKAAAERMAEEAAASGDKRRGSFMKSFSVTKMEVIKEQRKHKKNERSKAVANQGLFYAGTFALVWIFGTIVRAMQLAGATPPWAIIFLFAVFTPSQGFFNFLVYIRPRVVRYFAGKKKSRRESVDSFSSNGIHVSGISAVSGTSSVENRRDVSMKSEDLKLMDPFMKSAPEKSDESEQSTVKTRFDTSLDEAASDGKNEN